MSLKGLMPEHPQLQRLRLIPVQRTDARVGGILDESRWFISDDIFDECEVYIVHDAVRKKAGVEPSGSLHRLLGTPCRPQTHGKGLSRSPAQRNAGDAMIAPTLGMLVVA